MRIAVLGMGYVGCVTAAMLAREGRHRVIGIDRDAGKVEKLARGESPVLEPGLPELIRRATFAGHLAAATEAPPALAEADVIIVCVGTPSADHGGLDAGHLVRAAGDIGAAVATRHDYPVVIMRSTVLPGVLEDEVVPALERTAGGRVDEAFGLVVNPEFLREGSSIADFEHPAFTLIGADDARAAAVVERLYGFLAGVPVVRTDRRTAALVKYASNAFHAMKVAFANEIDAVSRAAGADGRDVMRIFALDRKLNVSASYLRPGMPFGGSCLPKDVRALLHYGRRHDVRVPLLDAVMESNRLRTESCVHAILAHGRARIGVLGLAFKAGTDDLRESPTVEIIERLLGKGAEVAVYDGRVALARLVGANREYLARHLPHVSRLLRPRLEDVAAEAEVLVIGNADPEFHRVPGLLRPGQRLIDLVGTVAPAAEDGGAPGAVGGQGA
jgi:GDP-mannose 6-dehydrogenase